MISWTSLAVASGILGMLILRRWYFEKSQKRQRYLLHRATQAFLERLDNRRYGMPQLPLRVRMDAMSHLLQLVRGSERKRLLEIADEDDLFVKAIRRSKSANAARRSEAIQVLEQYGSEQCVQALRRLMASDPVPLIQLEAASALARLNRLPSPRDTISLLSLQNQEATPMHRAIFRALAVDSTRQLIELLSGPLPNNLRALIVDSLGYSGATDITDLLERESANPDREVRCAATRAARHLNDRRAEHWIVARLDDPDPYVRVQAVQTAAQLGLKHALPKLAGMSNDPSPWVRVRVVDALSQLATEPTQAIS